MKPQAWGWLATAVLAAGLNSSYHNGGMEWAHRIADRVEHNSAAVLALATGDADRFLAEARLASAENSPACPMTAAFAAMRRSIAPTHSQRDRFEAMTARREASLAQLVANRAHMEAQFARLNMTNFNPVVVRIPRVNCSRVRVNVPRIDAVKRPVMYVPKVQIPDVQIPAVPVVNVDYSGPGPV